MRGLVHPIKRRLAKYYVWLLQKLFGLKVIGITGSTGKTTAKEMLASVLKLTGETVYSFANIDPVYNIPTTILRCRPSTKFLVLEMGIEYPNEMDFYLWLVKPDIGVITNIYPTHTLYFKNEEGVFKEKSKLVRNISQKGFAILNKQNIFLKGLNGKLQSKIIWYGNDSNVYGSDIYFTSDFTTKFTLHNNHKKIVIKMPMLGRQFVENALAATATASALGIGLDKIKKGLESFEVQDHRMKVKILRSGAVLMDDSYNSNPEAAKEAVKTLKEVGLNRKTILVFGDMLELGPDEVKYHKKLGKFIKEIRIDFVVGVGQLSKNVVSNKKLWAKSWNEVVAILKTLMDSNSVILVKGSRSMSLDKLVDVL